MNFNQHPLAYFLGFLSTGILLYSCSESDTSIKSDQSSGNYHIEKIDSFEVNNLTRVIIRDYSPEEKKYLGYAMVEDDFLEISEEGEILKRAHKKGEGLGLYGNWNPIGMGFGPSGMRIAELPFSILAYNRDFEEIYRQRIQSPLPIRGFGPMGRTEYYQNQDSTYFLVGPSNYLSAHYLIHNEEGRDTLTNFYSINIQSGDMKSVLPYREESIYKQTLDIYPELMTKSFVVDHETNELLVLHGLENKIEVYSLPSLDFKESIPIDHSEFLEYSPVPIGINSNDDRLTALRLMSGRNQNLIQIDKDLFLIKYFTGVTEGQFNTRRGQDAIYSPANDTKEQKILLISGRKQVAELESIPGSILFGLGDGKFLVVEPENTEIEEEVTRFSIYQVQN
ncbi:hypothetical protein [Algoriphagus sp. PAP.12]|uniref:hypothetical protein n=1 Tax=Algoriphagus sp. PAP.12 TaxID=2996678 RepID=UPI00227BE023|nr:hypothetical protein [Algoriphagus sp. PAP.12]